MEIFDAIQSSLSKGEVCRKMKWSNNGRSFKKIDEYIFNNSLKVNFSKIVRKRKYELITKECPVCGNEFITQKGHKKEKTTCSYSCSNTYHRSGENHPNYIDGLGNEAEYRKICFKYHKKECVVCGEKNIVEVHHLNSNHEDNRPDNLIPLCPTHHRYWHSRFRSLINDIVNNYIILWVR